MGKDKGAAPDTDLELFASFVREGERKEREAKKAAKAERRAAAEHDRLIAAKEEAAATVKRLRSRTGVSAEERAAADEAYRLALAAVVAAETGEAPSWAPEPEPEPDASAASEAGAEMADEAAPTDPDGSDAEPPASEGESADPS